jgi:hypothetical protein
MRLMTLSPVVPAMIHSFMWIYQVGQDGTINEEYNTDPYFWTGTVAIIALAYLVFASWAIFRNMNYELFKKFVVVFSPSSFVLTTLSHRLHFIMGGLYIVALFIHCQALLTSWYVA